MKLSSKNVRVSLIWVAVGGAVALYFCKAQADVAACASSLPGGLKLSSELFDFWDPTASYFKHRGKGTTVRAKLLWLGAYSRDGRIYDRGGNPIVFRQVQCEGPPPPPNSPALDWPRRQREALAMLREQGYTVVTYCGVHP
jgi:hypothetical protein